MNDYFLNRSFLLFISRLMFIVCVASLSFGGNAQKITIKPNNYKQKFYGTGGAQGKNPQHFNDELTEVQQNRVRNWLTRDLPFLTYRTYRGGESPYDNEKDWQHFIDVYHALKEGNSNLKFHLVMNAAAKNRLDRLSEKNVDDAVYEELAELYFEAIEYLYMHGVIVDGLEPLNEPGGESVIPVFAPIFNKTINKLRNKLKDKNKNWLNMSMPKIIGPSTWGTLQAVEWVEKLRKDYPKAWNNIDVVAIHNYSKGTVRDNFAAVRKMLDGRDFILNESTGKPQDDDVLSVGQAGSFTGALVVGYKLTVALNGGVNEYYAFQATGKDNNVPLVSIYENDSGVFKVKRPSQHFAYRHFMGLPPEDSNVIQTALSGLNESYIYSSSFRKKDTQKIYVNVVNLNQGSQVFELDVTSKFKMKALKHVVTNAAGKQMSTVESAKFSSAKRKHDVSITGYSVNTFVIDIEKQ